MEGTVHVLFYESHGITFFLHNEGCKAQFFLDDMDEKGHVERAVRNITGTERISGNIVQHYATPTHAPPQHTLWHRHPT